jgi:hypothetical protein
MSFENIKPNSSFSFIIPSPDCCFDYRIDGSSISAEKD